MAGSQPTRFRVVSLPDAYLVTGLLGARRPGDRRKSFFQRGCAKSRARRAVVAVAAVASIRVAHACRPKTNSREETSSTRCRGTWNAISFRPTPRRCGELCSRTRMPPEYVEIDVTSSMLSTADAPPVFAISHGNETRFLRNVDFSTRTPLHVVAARATRCNVPSWRVGPSPPRPRESISTRPPTSADKGSHPKGGD